MSVYKSFNHRVVCRELKLCNDIEKNPGPFSVQFDVTKTICAPYSQGNVSLFGQNAGQQCVAMSLCALLYNKIRTITSPQDMIEIMNVGNQLYGSLSLLTRQSFLLLSELPTMVTVFEQCFQLEYSESYTGNIQGDARIEGYEYCMPLSRALETILSLNYESMILTVGCISVGIYSIDNGRLKLFDSHARDVYGNSHPKGTCVLLELSSIYELVEYFQGLYRNNDTYELKGVRISSNVDEDCSILNVNDCLCSCKECCAVALYAMCYSIVKPCGYWNLRTLGAVVTNGIQLFNDMGISTHLMPVDLPRSVSVCGAEINVVVHAVSNGVLCCNLSESKSTLAMLILNNCHQITGFLLWLGNYCISCVFHQRNRVKNLFSLFSYDDSCSPAIKHIKGIKDIDSVVEAISKLIQTKFNCQSVKYEIQFILCSCKMENTERKKILRNHRRRYEYVEMEPAEKKICLEKRIQTYQTMDCLEKKELINGKKPRYQSMKDVLQKGRKRIDFCIERFKNKIIEGPYYICCVCNRLLYKKSVVCFCKNKYPCQNYFSVQTSFDGKEYICKSCHLKVKDGKLPCQAVVNKMHVDEIPTELLSLEKLEQILIAQRIVFEKIVVLPKGQQRKIKGAICNVPVECHETCRVLPRPSERSGIIMLKLKRKLEFRGHVYFQAVRPELILEALKWLKRYNILYKDVKIDLNNIDANFRFLEHDRNDGEDESMGNQEIHGSNVVWSNISSEVEGNVEGNTLTNNDNEEIDDPLNEYRSPVNEMCLQSIIPKFSVSAENNKQSVGNEVYSIAPGENKQPLSFFTDKESEELAFPVLFPKGKFGYAAGRDVKLSPVK